MSQKKIDNDFHGELGIIALESARELGKKLDHQLKLDRLAIDLPIANSSLIPSYLIPLEEIRFSNGEGKIKLKGTVRGKDIYVICDIGNYSCTYDLYGFKNHKGPDEHFQDIKRAVSAIGGKANRVTVIMPLLYASRQHRRKGRESMDCALALQELERLGVKDIITFDVHDPNIQNAIPLSSFENLYATYEIVKALLEDEREIIINKGDLLIISPDLGAMDRCVYYSSIMDIDIGLFYKRRDYSTIVAGRNPIVQHEYLGRNVSGKNIIIIDDMISTGESVFDIAQELKKRNANKIFIATTFALFTKGIEKFTQFYDEGIINKVYSTNLTYVPESYKNLEWFHEVDMSKYLAAVIGKLNRDQSIKPIIDSTNKLKKTIQEYRK